MSREIVLKKLEEIFRDIFDDEKIRLDEQTALVDIENWDSLQNIHVLVAIEVEFGLRISVEEAASLETIGQMLDVIIRGEG